MADKDKLSEASRGTGSSFRKARYNLDSCASRIADTTGESMNARFRMTTTTTATDQTSPSNRCSRLCCWDKPGRFSFYKSWNLFHETVYEGQNVFRTGRLAIGLVPLTFL